MPLPLLAAAGMTAAAGVGSYLAGKGTKGATQQNFTPIQSLQPNMQNNLNRFDVGVNGVPIAAGQNNRRFYTLKPGDSGFSQAAYDLQAANPDSPMEDISIEPHNAAQNSALDQYEDPIGSLAQYMGPSEKELQARFRGANRVYDNYIKRITEQNAFANSKIDPTKDTQMQEQMKRIEDGRAETIGDIEGMMERQGIMDAMNYRQQSLQDMMFAGNMRQGAAQQQADQMSGYNQTVNNPAYGQASAINQLYAPLMGGGGYQNPGRVTSLGQVGGALMRAPQIYGQFNGMYGGGANGTAWNSMNPYGNPYGQHFGGY